MLDIGQVDLGSLVVALEDHSPETTWWFDPTTGEVAPRSAFALDEEAEDDPEARGLIPVEPIPSSEGYRDMEQFVQLVRDPGARDLLDRALRGRGAFRRFKDTLLEFPQLREAWFRFHNARMERRSIQWLADEGMIDHAHAEREAGQRPDPDLPELSGALDPDAIARAAADDLRQLYGRRLKRVVLFGSWARKDAHPESDIDLLVVLDRVDSVWEELRRMDPILWRHSVDNDTVVTAVPVAESSLSEARWPLLLRAQREGHLIA